MNVISIVLSLLIGCSPVASNLEMNKAQGVKSFCEVMKNPQAFRDKPITLEATAHLIPGGMLLKSDGCESDISVHYQKGFERQSNAEALELLKRFERQVHEAQSSSTELKVNEVVNLVFEGSLAKNPDYHLEFDRGAQTLAAWDYHQEYAFVVSRVVSVQKR